MRLKSLKFMAVGACIASISPTLFSCSSQENNKEITRIDLKNKNYQMIFLGQQDSDSKPRLYGLSAHFDAYPIDDFYRGSDGKEHNETCAPLSVRNISDRYFFFVYQEKPKNNGLLTNYLVDKISGECFPFPKDIFPVFDVSETRNFNASGKALNFPCDKNNNMYCVCEQINANGESYKPLYKINFSNPNKIITQKVSDGKDSITGSFGIDADGNIAYSYKDAAGNWAYKFISANGVVTSTGIVPEGATSAEIWTNPHKEINFICNAPNEELNIYKVNFSNDKPQKELYKNFKASAKKVTGAYLGFEGYKGADTFKSFASVKTSLFFPASVIALTNDNKIVCLYSEQESTDTETLLELWEFKLDDIFDIQTKPENFYCFYGGEYNFLTIGKEIPYDPDDPDAKPRSRVNAMQILATDDIPHTMSCSYNDEYDPEYETRGFYLHKSYSCTFDDDCLKDAESFVSGDDYVVAAIKDANDNDTLALVTWYGSGSGHIGLLDKTFKNKIECLNDMPGIWKY